MLYLCNCDPGGIRTHDPQLRRLLLYPAELRDQSFCLAAAKVVNLGLVKTKNQKKDGLGRNTFSDEAV